MPCNASEATSMFQRRRINLPDFPVTLAMIHNEPGAHPYSTQMLKDAIKFIEEEYGEVYDWDALFERAKHMNEQNTLELEKWDFFKTDYSPLSGISETLYRLYAWASVNGQEDYITKDRPQGHKDYAPLLREEVRPLRRQDAPPRLPLGPERGCTIPTSRPGRRTAGASR